MLYVNVYYAYVLQKKKMFQRVNDSAKSVLQKIIYISLEVEDAATLVDKRFHVYVTLYCQCQ